MPAGRNARVRAVRQGGHAINRRGRGQDKKGRSKSKEQYIGLPHNMVQAPAFRALGGAALKVYIELHSRFWGGNNGKLSLSLEDGSKLLGLGENTIRRALAELEEKGFIVLTRRGQFVGRRASEYRLTAKPYDGHLATRDWQRWSPGKPVNSEHGSEVAHIGWPTVPFQNRGGKLCAI